MKKRKNSLDLSGKTVLVVGATGGLGRAICAEVKNAGASLFITSRSGKDDNIGADKVLALDLTDLDSVRKFARDLIASGAHIDFLILNAGVIRKATETTKDGHEIHFQVNFLAQVLLAKLLLPITERVIFQSSMSYRWVKVDWSDPEGINETRTMKRYGKTKYLLNAAVLALIETTDKPIVLVHPGIVKTKIIRGFPKPIKFLANLFMPLVFQSPRQGARATIMAMSVLPPKNCWLAPSGIYEIWGKPKIKPLKGDCVDFDEQQKAIALVPNG
ncbi:MAG: SDR family NAD(P)-dependent oxidoreductase [Christensenellaceae bacterium]|jgi:NAD(P)-dependent dehydrogenase (short-subunit alcohol dehydrogenase family)|nr:SDR family NAD(P)-dependent oxidoreductase [Christensenellaceae bacterium]